ncbi:MAG: hypothetical protein IPJ10_00080 [Flavobacteriales bacterium]|nr:hypothetical protein [Flavobacteriales bacterium]
MEKARTLRACKENDRKAVMKLMGQWSKRHGVEVGKSLIAWKQPGTTH